MPLPSPPPLLLPFVPARVIVFTGHIVDAPGRPDERFPPRMLPAAARRIGDALDAMQCSPCDIAITQGSAGADILFIEACVQRRITVQLMLPLPEPQFIERSIESAADAAAWKDRYLAARSRLGTEPAVMPGAPGNPFERCNAWMLGTAVASGAARLELLCLWNGAPGDAGGTAHMVLEGMSARARITWIDTREL
jgi:hypothetical protein